MVHDISLRFLIDGTWTDFTSHLSASTDPLEWAHGRPDEASQSDPSGCSFSLVDPTGRFVEENPRSDLFGRFGRGTLGAIRWDVDPEDHYVDLPGHDSQDCNVPHNSSFNTGNLALQFTVDCAPSAEFQSWLEMPSDLYPEKRVLMSRWGSGSGFRSWRFYITRDGYLGVTTSDNGVTVSDVQATAKITSTFFTGRLQLRASYDGFNGEWLFYANDGIFGFLQIGDPVIGFSDVADVEVAVRLGSQGPDPTQEGGPFHGRIYRGTVEYGNFSSSTTYPNVMFDADFRAAETAISPLPDGTRIEGSATLVDPSLAFIGEVVSTAHGGDKAEATQFTKVTMAGLSRRLNPPDSPVGSVYRTAMRSGQDSALLAYWPCEDPVGASAFSSLVTGTPALEFKPNDGTLVVTDLADDAEWVASDALPTWNQAGVQATLAGPVPASGDHGFTLAFFLKLPEAGLAADVDFARVTFSGGETANIVVGFTTTGLVNLYFDDSPGFAPTAVVSGGDLGNLLGRAACIVVQVRPHPTTPVSNSEYELWALYEDGTSASITGTRTSDLGQVVRFDTQPLADSDYTDGDLEGSTVGQFVLWATGRRPDPVYPEYVPNIHQRFRAYFGESAGTRILRRSAEDGIPVRVEGHHLDTMRMGTMQRGSSVDQRLAAEKADGGILYDSPTSYSLVFRTLVSMLSQDDRGLFLVNSLGYDVGLFDDPWSPVFDDQGLRNDVTVKRTGGGLARAELESGPRSVQEPPNGARRYEVEEERQLAYDSQLQPYAEWLVSVGTAPGGRMPEVAFNIGNERVAARLAALRALKPGDRLQVTDPPVWMSPEHVELVIQAITWTLYPGTDVGTLALTCVPGEPWLVAFAEEQDLFFNGHTIKPLADAEEMTLVTGIDDSSSSALIATQAGHPLTEDFGDISAGAFAMLGGPEWGTQETVGIGFISQYLLDEFSRATSHPSWGSPDVGPAWTTFSSGAAQTFCSGDTGILGTLSSNTDAGAYTSEDGDGWEVEGRFFLSAVPTGSALLVAWRMNWEPTTGDFYQVGLTISPGGSAVLQCAKVVNGSFVSSGSVVNVPFTFSTSNVAFRVSAKKGTVRVLLRQANDMGEWTGWQAELATDGDPLPKGRFGVYAFRGASATNSPNVRWERLFSNSPQNVTLQRGERSNYSTAHADGTPFALRYPWAIGP